MPPAWEIRSTPAPTPPATPAAVRLEDMERLHGSGNWGNDGNLDSKGWPTANSLGILNTVWHTADGGPRP